MLRSAAQIEAELRTNGGVATTYARVDRNWPRGKGLLFDNTTLELVRPRIIHSLKEAGGAEIIVIPDKPWVLNDVAVAVKTKEELGLPENLDAILPSRMRFYTRGRAGRFNECDTSEVNYLCVRDSPSATAKR